MRQASGETRNGSRGMLWSGLLAVMLTSWAYQSLAALNDTGQTLCYNGISMVSCTEANTGDASPYPRQDGRYGRDAQAQAGQLTKAGGGVGGFDFTPLDSGSNTIAIANGIPVSRPTCTRDNVTGLTWEIKTNDGDLRSNYWTYTWYSSDGNLGIPNGGTCYTSGRCDTEKYVEDVNAIGLCGYHDWRLPTVKELQSIDLSDQHPSMRYPDPNYLPNTVFLYSCGTNSANCYWSDYWSATTNMISYFSSAAWLVDFWQGGQAQNQHPLDYVSHIMLVRGQQTLPDTFTDHGNGTVTQNNTGLMWAKCSEGQSGPNCAFGSPTLMTWDQALVSGRDSRLAGYSDWRVPNKKELESLVDFTSYPAFNNSYFPNSYADWWWSSTTWMSKWPENAFFVSVTGFNGGGSKFWNRAVRLVRSGQSFDALGGSGGGTSATLTVSVNGSGTVTSTPGSINCGSACTGSFTPGTTVMLTATPDSGYVFSGWGGDCAWSGATCTLTIDANRSAVAIFKSQNPWLIPPDRFEGGPVTLPSLGGEKAVVITHGWNADATGWVNDLAIAICNQLGNPKFEQSGIVSNVLNTVCSTPSGWVVYIYDWRKKADLDVLWGEGGGPWTAYVSADTVGKFLATVLDLRQRSYIHFIAHSAGSQVIDTATTWLKTWAKIGGSSAPIIHETFLDAYDPRGQNSPYGLKAEWSDNYVDTQWVAPDGVDYTQLWLKGAYSIDVTPAFSISSCEYSIYPIVEPASVCAHAWPYRFYSQTTDNPSGIGFPLSLEKGQSLATLLAQYPKGESCEIFSCEGGPRRMRALAQQRVREVFNPVPILSPTILEQSGTAQCTSGTWLCGTAKLNTSSLDASQAQSQPAQAAGTTAPTQDPAWLVVHILTDQTGNTLRLNWRFAAGGEGLLRVFVNEKLVREIDQRHVPAVSPEPESTYVDDLAPGTHKIAFRLDGYGTNPSGVELTGVELGQQTLGSEGNLLTVTKAGTGSGVVAGPGIDCGTDCSESYASGTVVNLTATPAADSIFAGWSPTSCGSPFTLAADTTCTATFNLANRPPVANAGPDQTLEYAGPSGANVTLDSSGSSDPDSDPLTFTWTGPFGTASGPNPTVALPLGTHTITLTVDDGHGGTATDTMVVTVRDTTPPVLSLPADLSTAATDASGTVVTYTASAKDLVDGAVTPNCTPASGSAFPIGTTTVSCTATDKAANTTSGSFKVTVVGTTPPGNTPFSAFSVNPLRINQRLKTLFLLSSFTLGSGNNGIDPTKEPVTLTMAGFTTTIPAGSFRKGSGPFGVYAFAGKIDGVLIEMLITPLRNNRFGFQAAAYGANPSVANNPVTVELAIGNDSGTTSVKPVIIK